MQYQDGRRLPVSRIGYASLRAREITNRGSIALYSLLARSLGYDSDHVVRRLGVQAANMTHEVCNLRPTKFQRHMHLRCDFLRNVDWVSAATVWFV